MKNNITLAFALLVAVLAASCAAQKPEGELTGSIGKLYNDGMDNISKRRYQQAVHTFEELERQYPYSGWATRGQVMSAYAQLLNQNYDDSLLIIDRFNKMHPASPDLAYMYYLRGLNYYYQMTDVNRDQGATEKALEAFNEVITRFPQSTYAQDARLKITLCLDHLAGKEMAVGRYYQAQKQYLPAINRFRAVILNFQTSSQTPEALFRLVESYLALGVNDEAVRAASILGYNYPASDWYKRAYDLLTKQKLAPEGQTREGFAKQFTRGIKDLF